MNELIQFSQNHLELSAAWFVVASALLFVQFRVMATGPKAISTQMLTNLVNREEAVVVDIRGANDFNKGHIHGALNIPLSKIKESTKSLEKYRNKPIIMVCQNGISVAAACSTLTKAGMERVYKLQGGMGSWVGDNLPVVK